MSDQHELPVWMYWTGGELPVAAQLCVESVRRHYADVRLLDEDGLRELGGHEVADLTVEELGSAAAKSDVVRIWLLAHFGGVWLDTDVVSLKPIPFAELLDQNPDARLIGFRNRNDRFATPVLVGKTCPFLKRLCARLIRKAKSPDWPRQQWGVLGPRFLGRLARHHPRKLLQLPRQPWLHPWSYPATRQFPVSPFKPDWDRPCYAAHVCNQTIDAFADMTREEILQHGSLFAELLKRSDVSLS